jgi:hypothetical protein
VVCDRQEAIGIPNLLVAPKEDVTGREIYENGVGDYRGSYADGAYYAASASSEVSEEQASADRNLAYFDSIMTRFETLRDQLQSHEPPPEALAKLDKDHPTHVGALDTKVARWWRWKMRTIDPWPAQICSMDKSTVLRLLGLLAGGTLLKRGSAVDLSVSRWAWSLLARLPERGELTSEEIGVVRELGKKAVLLGMGLKEDAELDAGMDEVDPEHEEDEEDPDDGEVLDVVNEEEIDLDIDASSDEGLPGVVEERAIDSSLPAMSAAITEAYDVVNSSAPQSSTPSTQTMDTEVSFGSDPPDLDKTIQPEDPAETPDDLEAAKARLLGNLNNEGGAAEQAQEHPVGKPSKWNTRATVDMIITVAGEAYGQRDLLEFRGVWDQIV